MGRAGGWKEAARSRHRYLRHRAEPQRVEGSEEENEMGTGGGGIGFGCGSDYNYCDLAQRSDDEIRVWGKLL